MRVDHVVIAVRNLAHASDRFRMAGFDVRPGGRHVGFGTENAIIRFGLDYLELITVHDRDEALRASARSRALAEYLVAYESGLLGYALAGGDLDQIADRIREAGGEAGEPTPMSRRRPDGILLEWRLLVPGGVAWRKPWPFFIEWTLPDAERLAIDAPGRHSNGATGIAGVSIAAADYARAEAFYRAVLGEPFERTSSRARYDVGGVAIEVVGPSDARARGLERGPGPFELRLSARGGTPRTEAVLPDVVIAFG